MRKFNNIRLRKSPIVVDRVGLINRVIRECITESFDSTIETEYEVEKHGDIIINRFKTNSGNSYDLEFISGLENCDNKILNNGKLGDYTKTYVVGDRCLVPTVDIAFVPSEINMDDRDNHELYTRETNRNEQFELMGRIVFLVRNFINNNPTVNTYIIGKNTKNTKLKMYLNVFNNIFTNQFIKLEGDSNGYKEGCYYFIKKNIK